MQDEAHSFVLPRDQSNYQNQWINRSIF